MDNVDIFDEITNLLHDCAASLGALSPEVPDLILSDSAKSPTQPTNPDLLFKNAVPDSPFIQKINALSLMLEEAKSLADKLSLGGSFTADESKFTEAGISGLVSDIYSVNAYGVRITKDSLQIKNTLTLNTPNYERLKVFYAEASALFTTLSHFVKKFPKQFGLPELHPLKPLF